MPHATADQFVRQLGALPSGSPTVVTEVNPSDRIAHEFWQSQSMSLDGDRFGRADRQVFVDTEDQFSGGDLRPEE